MRADLWNVSDPLSKLHFRARNMTGRATLRLVNDTGPLQLYQFEGFAGELRDNMQRLGTFGFTSIPLQGAIAVTLHHGGYRAFNTAAGIEDPRYRPTGGNPGESVQYMVDGASASDGTGGTACQVIAGRQGKIIDVGDANSVTINLGTAANSVAINMGGSGATVNITGANGDVVINGISLVNHVHSGVTPGDGDSGKPVS